MIPVRSHSPRGYTLIELMAVLAIIAIVMGWGLFNFESAAPSYQLDRAADELAATLRDARDQAVLCGRAIRVEVVNVAKNAAAPGEIATAETADESDVYDQIVSLFWDEPAPGQNLYEFLENEQPFDVRKCNPDVIIDHALIGADELVNLREPCVVKCLPSGVCTPIRFYLFHRRSRNTWRTVRLNPLTGLPTVVPGQEEAEHWELRAPTQGGLR